MTAVPAVSVVVSVPDICVLLFDSVALYVSEFVPNCDEIETALPFTAVVAVTFGNVTVDCWPILNEIETRSPSGSNAKVSESRPLLSCWGCNRPHVPASTAVAGGAGGKR